MIENMVKDEYEIVLGKLEKLTKERGLEIGILNFLNKLLRLKQTRPGFRFTHTVLDREVFSDNIYLGLDEFDEYSKEVLKEYCTLYPNSILENLCDVLPEAYYNITEKDNLKSFIKKIYDTPFKP
jgi:hypothetical protein